MSAAFRHRLRVRYQECDPQGVVYFARYLDFVDIALTELWRERFGSYKTLVESGTDMVVAEATVRYRDAARFDDEIDIELAIGDLGRTSMVTRARILRGGALLAEASIRQVFIEPATRTKKPIPDEVRTGLAGMIAA